MNTKHALTMNAEVIAVLLQKRVPVRMPSDFLPVKVEPVFNSALRSGGSKEDGAGAGECFLKSASMSNNDFMDEDCAALNGDEVLLANQDPETEMSDNGGLEEGEVTNFADAFLLSQTHLLNHASIANGHRNGATLRRRASATPGHPISNVWMHFSDITDLPAEMGPNGLMMKPKVEAWCRYCRKKVRGTKRVTSNFITHLKSHHRDSLEVEIARSTASSAAAVKLAAVNARREKSRLASYNASLDKGVSGQSLIAPSFASQQTTSENGNNAHCRLDWRQQRKLERNGARSTSLHNSAVGKNLPENDCVANDLGNVSSPAGVKINSISTTSTSVACSVLPDSDGAKFPPFWQQLQASSPRMNAGGFATLASQHFPLRPTTPIVVRTQSISNCLASPTSGAPFSTCANSLNSVPKLPDDEIEEFQFGSPDVFEMTVQEAVDAYAVIAAKDMAYGNSQLKMGQVWQILQARDLQHGGQFVRELRDSSDFSVVKLTTYIKHTEEMKEKYHNIKRQWIDRLRQESTYGCAKSSDSNISSPNDSCGSSTVAAVPPYLSSIARRQRCSRSPNVFVSDNHLQQTSRSSLLPYRD